MRHYTTINVSQIGEVIAAEALVDRCRLPLLSRSNALVEANIRALEKFVDEHEECSCIKPCSGTTVMLKFARSGRAVDDTELSLQLLKNYGVLLCPANVCFSKHLQE